jgi:opacity protein-like surface antigen
MTHFFANQPNRRASIVLGVGLVALVASSGAVAQETRWYIAADIGQSKYSTESRDVGIVGGSFDRKDTQSGVAVGAQLAKGIAVELGFADFGKAKISGLGATPCPPVAIGCTLALYNISGDAQAKATHLSLVSSVALIDGLSFYGRLGAARTDRSANVRVNNVIVSTSAKKSEAIYGLGLRYAFTPGVEGTLEWKRLDNTKVDSASLGLMLRF